MELKWLEDFLMLAREGSFSRAAFLRNVTQPAFSRRVRALEHWLGVTLFDRSTSPIALTRHGEEFLRHAQHIVDEALGVRADFRVARLADDELVRILTLHTLSIIVMPGITSAFRKVRPRARVELLSSLQGLDTHYDALDAGAAHVLVAYRRDMGGRKAGAYRELTLIEDAFVPVAAPALAEQIRSASPSGKAAIPVIAYSDFTFSHGLVDPVIKRLQCGQLVEIVVESTLSEAHRALALQSVGIAWLPRSSIVVDLAHGDLVPVLDNSFHAPMLVQAICRADLTHPAALALWRMLSSGMPQRHETSRAIEANVPSKEG